MKIPGLRPRFGLRALALLVAAAALACWGWLYVLSPTGRLAVLLRPDQPASVRREAAASLGRDARPWEGDRACGLLIAALDDPSPRVRESATVGLTELGPAATPALPRVVAHLDDPDRRVRFAMARALGKLVGEDSPCRAEVIDLLTRTLADPDQDVRLAAAESLVELGAEGRALGLLLDLRDGDDAPAQAWADRILRRGRPFHLVAGDLGREIRGRDEARRVEALQVLLRIAPPYVARQALESATRSDDPEVARWATAEAERIARAPGR